MYICSINYSILTLEHLYHPSTHAIHGGNQDESAGAVVSPIYLSTTFQRAEDGSFVEGRDIYTRASNPNRRQVETKLAQLEKGKDAVAFSSGQAATFAIFHSLGEGKHIIIPDDIYYNTRLLLTEVYQNWNIRFSVCDMTDIKAIQAAIQPDTALIWIETPSNPQLKVTDIQAISSLVQHTSILIACDNTWATPYCINPFDFGAHLVMHSTTKFLGGHSDFLGGVVITSDRTPEDIAVKIRQFQIIGGGVPSPFDCWLLNRSLSTFYARMPLHCTNALQLAQFLEQHPNVVKVNYPGLPTHESFSVSEKQMKGNFGGMLSILVKGTADNALAVASHLKIFKHATSLGGVESLIEHRQSVEGVHSVSPPNLLRISVGIEHIEDLIHDFEQSFHTVYQNFD